MPPGAWNTFLVNKKTHLKVTAFTRDAPTVPLTSQTKKKSSYWSNFQPWQTEFRTDVQVEAQRFEAGNNHAPFTQQHWKLMIMMVMLMVSNRMLHQAWCNECQTPAQHTDCQFAAKREFQHEMNRKEKHGLYQKAPKTLIYHHFSKNWTQTL